MKPAANQGNPGVSLNFDAQALHDAEEAEYQKEEQAQQQELRDLLTTAFDDLSEEDDDDDDSQSTNENGSEESHDVTNATEDNSELGWQSHVARHPGLLAAHASTPLMGGAPPPLATSAAAPYAHVLAANHPVYSRHPLPDGVAVESQYMYHQTGNVNMHPQQPPQGVLLRNHNGPVVKPPMLERGETEGGNDEEIQHYVDPSGHPQYPYIPPQHPQQQDMATYGNHYGNYYPKEGYHGNQGYDNLNTADLPYEHQPLIQDQGQEQGQPPPVPHEGGQFGERHDYDSVPISQPLPRPMASLAPTTQLSSDLDNYKVKYLGTNPPVTRQLSQDVVDGGSPDQPSVEVPPRPTTPGKEYDTMQKEFLSQGGSPESRRLAQLQILYNARGRKIEELDRELNNLQDNSDRDIRILKHKLALVQDERDGLAKSLEQSQDLLQEAKGTEADLCGKIAGLEAQITSLSTAKEELLKKLQTAESTIETLNAQLLQLGSSDSLSRAREQHDSIIAGLQQKYEREILALKEKLDVANQEKDLKVEEIGSLRKQVSELIKSSEDAQINRADTINRLTKSLEESQRQCQELLEAGTGQELSKLKVQIQDLIASKSIAEDMNSSLQSEIQELKEQVTMYESASHYGVLPSGSTNAHAFSADDSYAQLGIKKPQQPPPKWRTPDSVKSDDLANLTTDETIHGLKSELERCLAMYRNKRQVLTQVQEELRSTKVTLEEARSRLQTVEKEALEYKDKLKSIEEEFGEAPSGSMASLKEGRLQREVSGLRKEKEALLQEVQELRQRIEEIAASEENVKEANCELSAQMAQMVREFDEDKRQALEKCQETCLQHHEDMKHIFQEELMMQSSQDKQKLIDDYEHQLRDLRSDLTDIQKELDDVKSMYINVCESKDHLQEALDKQWEEKMEKELEKIKRDLSQEKEEEVETMKMTLANNSEVVIATAKEKWLQEQEQEVKRKLDAELALAKVEWFKEHQKHKEAAVVNLKRALERQWMQKWDNELDHQVETKLQEAKETWEAERQAAMETELQRRLEKSKETWRQTDLEAALAAERLKWEQSAADSKSAKTEVDMFLQSEKEQIQKQKLELERALEKINNSEDSTAKLKETTEKYKQEIDALKSEKHKLEKELASAKDAWLEEKQTLLQKKDLERRQAVQEIQDQCEGDYKEFIKEHQNTLNKALKSARLQFAQEKDELFKKHAEEIEELKSHKEKETKTASLEQTLAKEKAELEKGYQQKVEVLMGQHQREKEEMMIVHRENLVKALEEAGARWQKKYEEALGENSESGNSVQLEKEKRWEEERKQYQQELARQEQLLQSADEHLEGEITKLQTELTRNHKQEMCSLEERLNEKHKQDLEKELDNLRKQLEQDFQQQASRSGETTQKLSQELDETKSRLEQLEKQYSDEVSHFKKVIEKREKEIRKLRHDLEESQNVIDLRENQHVEVLQQLEDCEKQLENAKKKKVPTATLR